VYKRQAEDRAQHPHEESVRINVEPTHDAPIYDAHATIAQEQQVASVDIAVECSPTNGHHKKAANQLVNCGRGIKVKRLGLINIVNRDAVQEFHGQHTGGCLLYTSRCV